MITGIGRLRFKVNAAPAVQIADFHAIQCRAPCKGMFPDCCNSAWDSDAGEGRAVAKCRTVDGNNRENTIIVADGVWDGHIAVIGIGAAGDDGMAVNDAIVYVAYFQVLPRDGGRQQDGQQQDDVFDERFHSDAGRYNVSPTTSNRRTHATIITLDYQFYINKLKRLMRGLLLLGLIVLSLEFGGALHGWRALCLNGLALQLEGDGQSVPYRNGFAVLTARSELGH